MNPSIASSVREALLDRFLRYVQIDTESDPNSTTYPSTEKQFDLLRLLRDELRERLFEEGLWQTRRAHLWVVVI